MQRFELTEDLLTHHDLIDAQHAVLVNILNEASQGASSAAAMERFGHLTDQLLDYAVYHFETEEQLMNAHRYSDRAPEAAGLHLSEHRGFATRVLSMREEFERDPRRVAGQQLVRFLQDWLVHHIGESDRELGAFLRREAMTASVGQRAY